LFRKDLPSKQGLHYKRRSRAAINESQVCMFGALSACDRNGVQLCTRCEFSVGTVRRTTTRKRAHLKVARLTTALTRAESLFSLSLVFKVSLFSLSLSLYANARRCRTQPVRFVTCVSRFGSRWRVARWRRAIRTHAGWTKACSERTFHLQSYYCSNSKQSPHSIHRTRHYSTV